ncbi:Hypothetical predicted protein, partial [Lecanosticta acicola]
MRASHALGVLILTSAASAAQPQKLTEIFDVDMRPYPANGGSCNRPRDPNDANSPVLFDADVDWRNQDKILNKIWNQMNLMVFRTTQSITPDGYNDNFDQRKLMKSFWGISPDADAGNGDDHQPKQGINLEKLNEVRKRYQSALNIMWTPRQDEKFKLFCGSSHMEFQWGDEYAFDYDGNAMARGTPADPDPWTIREWEEAHGRDWDDHWYFYTSTGDGPGESGYLLLRKDDWPAIPQIIHGQLYHFPFPWDPATEQPSLCAGNNQAAAVLMTDEDLPDNAPGAGAILLDWHVILCTPQAFSPAQGREEIPDEAQPVGTHLDTLEVLALTFLHEMFHLQNYDDSADQRPFRPLKGDDDGKPVP